MSYKFQGYVIEVSQDEKTLLEGASIFDCDGEILATTDENGYFSFFFGEKSIDVIVDAATHEDRHLRLRKGKSVSIELEDLSDDPEYKLRLASKCVQEELYFKLDNILRYSESEILAEMVAEARTVAGVIQERIDDSVEILFDEE